MVVINRETNGGIDAAIITGHIRGLQDNMDVLTVMAGDGQMDPEILNNILDPVIGGKAYFECRGAAGYIGGEEASGGLQ